MKHFIEEYGSTVIYVVVGTMILTLLFVFLKGSWKTYDQTPLIAHAQDNEEYNGVSRPIITVKKRVVQLNKKINLSEIVDVYQHAAACDGSCGNTCGTVTTYTVKELTGTSLINEGNDYFLNSAKSGVNTFKIVATNDMGFTETKTISIIFREE